MVKTFNSSEGAIWRKCDFHIHSKYSREHSAVLSIEDIFRAAIEKEIEMIAISDHSNCDGLDEIWDIYNKDFELGEFKHKYSDFIEFFPAVELKSSQGKKGVHFIAMFPKYINENKVDKSFLKENFLAKINYSDADIKKEGDGDYDKGLFLKCVDFEEASKIVKKLGGVIIVHNGTKENGFDSEISHAPKDPTSKDLLNSLGAKKKELMQKCIDICEFPNSHAYHQKEREFYLENFNKPCIICSDSHSEYKGELFTWIKADRTFNGIKQIISEASDRIFWGEKPPVLERVEKNKIKYINSLTINKINDYNDSSGVWFDNVELKLNKELVAIIGNKGSGKSAIADIIGLLGHSKNGGERQTNFSFLNPERFKKVGFANNFEAKILWEDGEVIRKVLDEDIDPTKKELVKYLPQNYFNSLTNEIEGIHFEKTLRDVIFLHIPESSRLDKNSFDDLEKEKIKNIEIDLDVLKKQVYDISEKSIELEAKKHPSHIKQISSLKELKKREINDHEKNKPVEVIKPSESDNDIISKEKYLELSSLNAEYDENEEIILTTTQKLNLLKIQKEDLSTAEIEVLRFENAIKKYIEDNSKRFTELDLAIDDVFKVEFCCDKIKEKVSDFEKRIESLNDLVKINDNQANSEVDPGKQGELINKRNSLQKSIDKVKNELSKPERDFQEYKEKIREWTEKDNRIRAELKYYEDENTYIQSKLSEDLKGVRLERISKTVEIFNKKKEIVNLYNEFKKSIDEIINTQQGFGDSFKIEIESGFKLSPTFSSDFLGFINKSKIGTFRGAEERFVQDMFSGKNLLQEENLVSILNFIIFNLENDTSTNGGRQVEISDQISKVQCFYDFIFSLEYLTPVYELKLDGKNLKELSPGEKGALLLVFYLMIDKDDTPLIIDQPEDNLDNKSVFEIMTRFIRSAKKRRQIIIVTHNPNLAVVADAEQIIYVEHDKRNNKFSYEVGAIENKNINKRIVEVLEGTMPAFDKRDQRYYRP